MHEYFSYHVGPLVFRLIEKPYQVGENRCSIQLKPEMMETHYILCYLDRERILKVLFISQQLSYDGGQGCMDEPCEVSSKAD